MSQIVLRYAPSPTGPQHIGGLRTALYCYLLAQQQNGELILRIEDTDQNRFVKGAEEFIIKSCNWLGIEFNQGVHIGGPHTPYRQSDRSELYIQFGKQLVEKGHAYYAFDTPEELEAMRKELEEKKVDNRTYNYVTRLAMRNSFTLSEAEVQQLIAEGHPYVIRFNTPTKEDIRFQDLVRGHLHFHSTAVDDKVLVKADGLPTYHLANVVDDYHMGVTHVVRGEEWLPSTPLHILLYKALGWEKSMPTFAHLALLLAPDGSKLSKRNADKYGIPVFAFNWHNTPTDTTWEGYANLGYLPEALLNYLALLGWHPGGENELMNREEMIAQFSLDRCHKAGAKFDLKKLTAFQQHYIRQKSNAELAELAKPAFDAAGLDHVPLKSLHTVAGMLKERITFAHDIAEQGRYFFQTPTQFDEKTLRKKWKTEAVTLVQEYCDLIDLYPDGIQIDVDWNATKIKARFSSFVESKAVGFGKVMAPLRLALTGTGGGPDLFEIMEFLGREECISRIQSAIQTLPAG